MHIGITVNDLASERSGYTTTQLAMTAVNRGHSVCYINVGDFALRPDDFVYAHAVVVPQAKLVSGKSGAISNIELPYWVPWAMIRS